MKSVVLVIVFALLMWVPVPVQADDGSGWRLRVDFALVDPGDDTWQSASIGTTASAEFDTGVGVGVRGEYQFSPRIGIDFGVLNTASVELKAASSGFASLDVETFTPLAVGVDFHLTPDKRVDLYLGPQVAWVRYDDVFLQAGPGRASASVSIDNDLGIGAILGLDVPLGEARNWAFQTNLRYLSTSMEGDTELDRIDVDFDPVIFAVGFGYRW